MNKQTLELIAADQLASLLSEQQDFIPRQRSLVEYKDRKEITVISGVRRSGKSSLLREFAKQLPKESQIIYLNFEDPRLLKFSAAEDFEMLYRSWLETNSSKKLKFALFDEIQNVEGWERWMNFYADQKKFKVFITGSNSRLLSSELATFLTGRHEELVLYPLSFMEIACHECPAIAQKVIQGINLTTEEHAALRALCSAYFKYGGFPRIWQSKLLTLLAEYYSDILNRDIVRRRNLRQPQLIAAFGAHLMSDLGRPLNKTRLAGSIGVKEANTINKYFSFFDECYLGHEVRKFDTSIRRQMRAAVKFYAVDPILASRVGISNESKEAYYLENFVYIELLRRGAKVYYWQEKGSSELDFVVETQEGERQLIQVSWNINNSETLKRELKGFAAFQAANSKLKIHKRLIITMDSSIGLELPKGISTLPFYLWAIVPKN